MKQSTLIIQALASLKIEALNPMQEASIETWKEGKDLILLSPTGTGKTLAYLLPLLETLKPEEKGVQAVVLVPSRELALQIDQVFKSMNTPYKVMSCYGGRPAMEEHRTMKGIQPSVIIGTPGRMNDHLSKQNFDASTVRTLVIDEFDKCLEVLGTTEDEVNASYDAIFHMVTTAKGLEDFYNFENNVARYETAEQAAALDDVLIKAWSKHPYHHIIENSQSVEDKMNRLLAEISKFLGLE